jgi:hypothetical protein
MLIITYGPPQGNMNYECAAFFCACVLRVHKVMCGHMFACVHACVYVCLCVCVCAWMCARLHTGGSAQAWICVWATCVWACVCLCAYVSVHGHVSACGFAGLFRGQSIIWLSGLPACSSLEVNNDLDLSFQTDHALLAAPAFKTERRWHFGSLSC